MQLADGQRPPRAVFGAHPVHVLDKVAYLVERVPHRKLQFALRRSLGQQNLHLHQVLLRRGQRDDIVGDRNRLSGTLLDGRPRAQEDAESREHPIALR